jgi:hypothetical protein
VIAHIVLFEPKSHVSDEERRTFVAVLNQALTGIPEIERARVGRRIVPDIEYGSSVGHSTHTYAAVLEFASVDRLMRYLNHSAHRELGRLFWHHCSSTVILDVQWADPISSIEMDI